MDTLGKQRAEVCFLEWARTRKGQGPRPAQHLSLNGVIGAQPHSFFYALSVLLSYYSESQVIETESVWPKSLKELPSDSLQKMFADPWHGGPFPLKETL